VRRRINRRICCNQSCMRIILHCGTPLGYAQHRPQFKWCKRSNFATLLLSKNIPAGGTRLPQKAGK
jgi:hypothetical protein